MLIRSVLAHFFVGVPEGCQHPYDASAELFSLLTNNAAEWCDGLSTLSGVNKMWYNKWAKVLLWNQQMGII